MRKIVIVLVVVLMSLPIPLSFSEIIDVNSKISEVVVYTDQATLIRTARVALTKGTHTLRIGGLPGIIRPNSVTAHGQSPKPVKLYGAQLDTRQLEKPQNARVRQIEEEMQELQNNIRSLKDTKQILATERKFLQSIQAASGEQISKDLITKQPSAEDAAAMLAFLDQEFNSNYRRAQDADIQIRKTKQTLDKLRRELREVNQARWKSETAILVDVEASDATTFDLEISYRLPGAGWSPSYEARANSEKKELQFS